MDTNPDWLSTSDLMDEGDGRALYPYPLLENILSVEDCRKAALNETEAFEQEFGLEMVQPLYQLLWRLNTIGDIFTSHTTTSPPDYKSPFDWAQSYVGSAIIIIPRERVHRHNQAAAEGMAGELERVLRISKFVPKDRTGWQINIFPTVVNFFYETGLANPEGVLLVSERVWATPGFGHELVISGSAGTRKRAAERWSRAVTFVCDTLAGQPQALPYRHYEIVNGQRSVPTFSDGVSTAAKEARLEAEAR